MRLLIFCTLSVAVFAADEKKIVERAIEGADENSLSAEKFKIYVGTIDGVRRELFNEVDGGQQQVEADNTPNNVDPFGAYDDNNVITTENEKSLFVPKPYRPGGDKKDKKTSTTTTTSRPTLPPTTIRTIPFIVTTPATPATQPPRPTLPVQPPQPVQPVQQPFQPARPVQPVPQPFQPVRPVQTFQPQPQPQPIPQPQPQPQPTFNRPPPPTAPPRIVPQQPIRPFAPQPQPQPQPQPFRPQPTFTQPPPNNFQQPFRTQRPPQPQFPQQPPQPTTPAPRAPFASNGNLRSGQCAASVFYISTPISGPSRLTFTHFAVAVTVDQCARTCHEFNCAIAHYNPLNGHCEFNPSTAFAIRNGQCPAWPSLHYRNNVVANEPVRIFCVTCQRPRRRPAGRRPSTLGRQFDANRRGHAQARRGQRISRNPIIHGVLVEQPKAVAMSTTRTEEPTAVASNEERASREVVGDRSAQLSLLKQLEDLQI